MSGFKKFLLRGNLVDLAVAVMIGAAFATVVKALTDDFLTPLLAAIGGQPNFAELSFTVNKSHFHYGDFINAVIAFVILAAVLYFFVVIPFSKMLDKFKPAPDEPALTKECTECLSSIPAAARKCAFCTSVQKAA
jgi:large conductance mechanosensitive channel